MSLTAAEMLDRLETKRVTTTETLGTLERERARIMPAALADEPEAVRRMVQVRADIATGQATLRDIATSIADLQAQLQQEADEAERQERRDMAGHFDDAADALLAEMRRADEAIAVLADVVGKAGPLLTKAQNIGARIIAVPNEDPGMAAINRMAVGGLGIRPLGEVLEMRLQTLGVIGSDLGFKPKLPSLVASYAADRASAAERIRSKLAADRHQADVARARRAEVEVAA